MKEETIFNPLPLPIDLQVAVVAEPAVKPAARKRTSKPRQRKSKPEAVGTRTLTQARIKAEVQRRLANLDPARLKRVLRACGLSVAVIASVILMAKFAPIALLLIAAMGITGLACMSSRLRCATGM